MKEQTVFYLDPGDTLDVTWINDSNYRNVAELYFTDYYTGTSEWLQCNKTTDVCKSGKASSEICDPITLTCSYKYYYYWNSCIGWVEDGYVHIENESDYRFRFTKP